MQETDHGSPWCTTSSWTCAGQSASSSPCATCSRRPTSSPRSTTRRGPRAASPTARCTPPTCSACARAPAPSGPCCRCTRAAMESLDLRGYDLVISSSSAWAHGVIPDEDAVHVCYCHNPFRYAWNAREETLAGARPAGARGARGGLPALAPVGLDRGAARRRLRRQLQTTKRRVARYFGREATVLHPPVDVERFTPGRAGDAYVVLSELMAHKRIEVAVRAFNAAAPAARWSSATAPTPGGCTGWPGPTVSFTGPRQRRRGGAHPRARAGARRHRHGGVRHRRRRGPGRRPARDRAARGRRARDRASRARRAPSSTRPSPRRWPRPSLAFDALAVDPAACVASARRFDAAPFRRGLRAVVDASRSTGWARAARRGAGRRAARAAWRARCEPPRAPAAGRPRSFRRLLAAAAALSGFTILRGYGPHDEGLMLAWARRIADGQWPYRDFWSNYAPGQPLLLAALVKLFGPSLLWWRIVRVAVDATSRVPPSPTCAATRARAGRWRAWVAVAGAMAWPSGPGPTRRRCALALGALLAARRAPLGAGALAGPGLLRAAGDRGGGARSGAMLEARRSGAATRAAGARSRRVVAAVAARALRHRRRAATWPTRCSGSPRCRTSSGCPSRWTTTAASTRTSCSSSTCPRSSWPAARCGPAGRSRAATASPSRRWSPSGSPTCSPAPTSSTCVPLSVALAIALALRGAAARRARCRAAALGVALALVAVHGLERRAGQALHPPRAGGDPGAGRRRRAHGAGRRRRAARR